MKYKFTRFERGFPRGDARISISRASGLRFSAKFCKITDILNYKYINMFYDSTNKAIGIQPTNKHEKGSFKITHEKSSGSVSISGFLNFYNLDPLIYHGSYDWTKESIPNTGDVYVIILRKQNETTT